MRQPVEGELRAWLQGRLAGVEQHVAEGDDHSAISLFRVQFRKFLLRLRELASCLLRLRLRVFGLFLRVFGLRLRTRRLRLCAVRPRLRAGGLRSSVLRFAIASLEQDPVALLLGARDGLACPCL